MKRLLLLPLCLLVSQCGRVGKIDAGKYEVADQEFSSENYTLERRFDPAGTFEERHLLDRCLMLEMKGSWVQAGDDLTLRYSESRNRGACRDSLPAFAPDSAVLEIPIRNVERGSFESFLAASDGKPEKWIRWIKAI